MTTNSQLLTTKPTTNKQTNKLSKQLEQEQIHRNGDHMEGYQGGNGRRRVGKGTENKQHKWEVENRQWEVKNSIGNGEANELICTIHGHELKGENAGGRGLSFRLECGFLADAPLVLENQMMRKQHAEGSGAETEVQDPDAHDPLYQPRTAHFWTFSCARKINSYLM